MDNFFKDRYYNANILHDCLYVYPIYINLIKMEVEQSLRPNIFRTPYLTMCNVGLKVETGFLFYQNDYVYVSNPLEKLSTIRHKQWFKVIKYRYNSYRPNRISLFSISETLSTQGVEKDLLYLKLACPDFAFINQTGRYADLFN